MAPPGATAPRARGGDRRMAGDRRLSMSTPGGGVSCRDLDLSLIMRTRADLASAVYTAIADLSHTSPARSRVSAELQRRAAPMALDQLDAGGDGARALALADVHADLGRLRRGTEQVHAAH